MIHEILHTLLQPRRLGDLLVLNRVLIAPLTRGRANVSEHLTDYFVRKYYEQRSDGGFIISEGTWISADGQGGLAAPRNRVQFTKTGKNNLTTISGHQEKK